MTDSKTFYDRIRPLFGKITGKQLEGMEAILNEWHIRGLTDLRWLAYIFGTVKHETANTMQPVREFGKGRAYPYGKPDPFTGEAYYGRGFCQLTHIGNYKKMGKRLGIDLVNNPDLALDMNIAVQILFEGMIFGLFTGKKLSDYFNEQKSDWFNARRIVNIIDKAQRISDISNKFYNALV